jgi:hypothetical protein
MDRRILRAHLAERVAADRGVTIEEADAIVSAGIRKAPAKQAKPDKTKGASERKKKRTKAKRAAKVPLTAKQKIARHFGRDDGRPRGGTPFLQGGAPGLGKR